MDVKLIPCFLSYPDQTVTFVQGQRPQRLPSNQHFQKKVSPLVIVITLKCLLTQQKNNKDPVPIKHVIQHPPMKIRHFPCIDTRRGGAWMVQERAGLSQGVGAHNLSYSSVRLRHVIERCTNTPAPCEYPIIGFCLHKLKTLMVSHYGVSF